MTQRDRAASVGVAETDYVRGGSTDVRFVASADVIPPYVRPRTGGI